MKCAACGKEFGDGGNCQNCGVDRFTGLGNYRGYNIPISTIKDDEEYVPYTEQREQLVTSQHHTVNVGSIVCYACGEVIPDNSKFCPYCGTELYVKCPKCGQTYSSQYPACNQCGTNREEYLKEKEKIKKAKTFVIPEGTVSISPNEFLKKQFEYVSIPSTVTTICESAFEGCHMLKEVVLPNTVSFIGDSAFYECKSLQNLVIPHEVRSIGKRAFAYCQSLKTINLPDIQVIEEKLFFSCSSLSDINIPYSVKRICNDAFWGCRSLNDIKIPESVTSIGSEAFGECCSLERINLPDSLIAIGEKVFNGCDSLNSYSKQRIRELAGKIK